MILTLLAVALNDQPLTRPITARFDANGGTVGRADHCTLALPDPERFISRKQAEVVYTSSGYMIRNIGSANPIAVAGRPLGSEEMVLLRHGDEVRVGGYELRAHLSHAAAPDPNEPTQDPVAQQTRLEPTHDAAALSAAAASPANASAPARNSPLVTPVHSRPPQAPSAAALAVPWAGPPLPLASLPVATAAPMAMSTGPAWPPAAPAEAREPDAARKAPAPAASVAAPGNPFADLLNGDLNSVAGQASGAARVADQADPFANLMGMGMAGGGAPAAAGAFDGLIPAAGGLDKHSAALGSGGSPASASKRLPDDFDPFRALSQEAANPAPALGHVPSDHDPFANLMGGASPASIDQAFGLKSGADGADALARFTQDLPLAQGYAASDSAGFGGAAGAVAERAGSLGMGAAPGYTRPAGSAASTDPLVALGLEPGPADAGAMQGPGSASYGGQSSFPAQADNLPMVHSAFRPPPVAAPPAPASPAPAPRAPAPALPYAAGAPHDLGQAGCPGAGVNLPMPAGSAAERLHTVGRVLRSAVEGTLQLMAVRASTKHEMRAAVTQIQARSNNPLKFAPDASTGVEQLVKPATRGFLEGPAAMEDAMNDLVGHSIGTVQGMRSAIEGMLGRFDPAELEQKLARGSVLDSLIPANRKARLWELYVQHHRSIREEAQEDFHALFGKAFVAAYEQQVERLKQGRAVGAGAAGQPAKLQ